jgi:hypothetical protein
MTRFEWDGLRPGDAVFLHLVGAEAVPPQQGEVAFVEVVPRRPNGVGVRFASSDSGELIVWPSRLAVHSDRAPHAGDCWRCDARAS